MPVKKIVITIGIFLLNIFLFIDLSIAKGSQYYLFPDDTDSHKYVIGKEKVNNSLYAEESQLQKKIAIHCKSDKALPPTSQDAQSPQSVLPPLSVNLSFPDACPLNDGTMKGRVTVELHGNEGDERSRRDNKIDKDQFESKNLDFDAIVPKLIAKGYVTEDLRVNPEFDEINKDEEFKIWLQKYTENKIDKNLKSAVDAAIQELVQKGAVYSPPDLKALTEEQVKQIKDILQSRDGKVGSDVEVTFTPEGNVNMVSPKTYTINDLVSNRPTTKNVELRITGPGMGSLKVHGDEIGFWGSSNSIFFLLAQDGDFIVNRSSYFYLETEKLTHDLQSGLITKSKYDEESRKMLEGKHTYVCSQIICYW